LALAGVDVDGELDVECLREAGERVDGGVVLAGLQARDLWLDGGPEADRL
jgi:hypothetical protein